MVLATIAGGYAVVKSNLARVMEDLEEHMKKSEDHRNKFDARLDDAESERTLFAGQIDTLKNINSPQELKVLHREIATITADIKHLTKQLDRLQDMHNGKHPPVGDK
jgi:predicted  nucleic acid-binding Zn-ribbon protein